MRVRSDKSYPNSYATAEAIFDTIKKPFTRNDLLSFIRYYGYNVNKGLKRPRE